MTRAAQREEELRSVEQMRRLLGGLPDGTIDPDIRKPDVCIVSGDRRIGVEVTELYRQPQAGQVPRQLLESEWRAIVARARQRAEAAQTPVVYVTVHFNENIAVRKEDREFIAHALAEIVLRNVPAPEDSVEVCPWREPNDLLRCVRTLRIRRLAGITQPSWSVPDSGWVQMDFAAELQQAIDAKNPLHAGYMDKCDECWLLITASGGRASGLFEASEDTKSHVYQSCFSRTFFLEVFGGKLDELNTESP